MRKVALHAKRLVSNGGNADMSQDPIETARELATHASDIKHLQDDMDKVLYELEGMKKTVDAINQKLDKVEGGWKTLIWLGGMASGITGIIGFIVGHFRG